jgi:hypothetical protein
MAWRVSDGLQFPRQVFSRLIFNRPSHILEDPEMFRRLIFNGIATVGFKNSDAGE